MTNGELVKKVQEAYSLTFRPNDPVISVPDILDFVDYCIMFYGRQGVYRYNFTFDEILEGMIKRFSYRPAIDFEGDTTDRELVCEMVFEIRERNERESNIS